MQTKKRRIHNIRKRKMKIPENLMIKDVLENVMLTSQIERKKGNGKQRVTYKNGLDKWIAVSYSYYFLSQLN